MTDVSFLTFLEYAVCFVFIGAIILYSLSQSGKGSSSGVRWTGQIYKQSRAHFAKKWEGYNPRKRRKR